MTKSMPGPTARERRELTGVKTTSLGTNLQFLLSGVPTVCQNLNYKLQGRLSERAALHHTVTQKHFLTIHIVILSEKRLHEDKLCDTLQAMVPNQGRNGSSNFLAQYREQPDRFRLFSPTYGQNYQQQSAGVSRSIPVLINEVKFLMPASCRKK